MTTKPVRRYGRRKFTKMYTLINDLRKSIRERDAEKTEAIWDQCEPFIDVVFEREKECAGQQI